MAERATLVASSTCVSPLLVGPHTTTSSFVALYEWSSDEANSAKISAISADDAKSDDAAIFLRVVSSTSGFANKIHARKPY